LEPSSLSDSENKFISLDIVNALLEEKFMCQKKKKSCTTKNEDHKNTPHTMPQKGLSGLGLDPHIVT
jgi:hypothetical protein